MTNRLSSAKNNQVAGVDLVDGLLTFRRYDRSKLEVSLGKSGDLLALYHADAESGFANYSLSEDDVIASQGTSVVIRDDVPFIAESAVYSIFFKVIGGLGLDSQNLHADVTFYDLDGDYVFPVVPSSDVDLPDYTGVLNGMDKGVPPLQIQLSHACYLPEDTFINLNAGGTEQTSLTLVIQRLF